MTKRLFLLIGTSFVLVSGFFFDNFPKNYRFFTNHKSLRIPLEKHKKLTDDSTQNITASAIVFAIIGLIISIGITFGNLVGDYLLGRYIGNLKLKKSPYTKKKLKTVFRKNGFVV